MLLAESMPELDTRVPTQGSQLMLLSHRLPVLLGRAVIKSLRIHAFLFKAPFDVLWQAMLYSST